jgi:eukaryotic-like serine/threonine-protein kinase
METLVILGLIVLIVGSIGVALRWTIDQPNMKYVKPIGLVVLTITLILEGIPLGNTIITNLQSQSSQVCSLASSAPLPSPTSVNTSLDNLLSDSKVQLDPTGEPFGVSGGNYMFDMTNDNIARDRRTLATQDKSNAMTALATGASGLSTAISDLMSATSNDPTDAEAQIYLEDLHVIQSDRPFITLVVGNTFQSATLGGARDVLQGVFIAQHECNNINQSMQLVVLIANANNDSQATMVAQQIKQAAQQDPSIVAVLGWTISSFTSDAYTILESAHILIVSPTASSTSLSNFTGFLRVTPPDQAQTQPVLAYLGQKPVALFYSPSDTYSSSLLSGLRNTLNVVDTETYNVGDIANTTLLPAKLDKALVAKPDYIYFTGDVANMLILLKNLSPGGPTLIGPDDLSVLADYPNNFMLPKDVHLMFTAFASSHEWDEKTLKPPFFQEYATKFDPGNNHPGQIGFSVPDSDAMLAYDAMTVLYDRSQSILSKNESITAEAMWNLKTIPPQPIQGVTGALNYNIKSNTPSDPVNKVVLLESMQTDGTIKILSCSPMPC